MEGIINMKSNSRLSKRRTNAHSEDIHYYIMFAPFFLMFFAFTVLPVLSSIVLSFTNYDMISLPKFNGVDNYARMFLNDKTFTITLKNTILLAIITGPVGFMLSFVLAWFINEFSPLVRTVLSFLFYAPALVGNAYFVWSILFSGDSYGYINSFLLSAGFITEPIQWLKNADYVMPIIVVVQLWQSMGVSFLANISGLQNVNSEMYEAGAIDGIRNRWQELWFITLPQLKPQLMFGAVMSITGAFTVGNVGAMLCGNPSTEYAVHTLVNHMTDYATVKYEFGYACAIATLLFLAMIACNELIKLLLKNVGR